MGFDALDIAVKLPVVLRKHVELLRLHDRELAEQIRRAINGVALAVGEGARREGKDRIQYFRVASGSASEARAAINVAEGWGYLKTEDLLEAHALLDRQLAILWRLIHPRSLET
jgi:four helix bundle protein